MIYKIVVLSLVRNAIVLKLKKKKKTLNAVGK